MKNRCMYVLNAHLTKEINFSGKVAQHSCHWHRLRAWENGLFHRSKALGRSENSNPWSFIGMVFCYQNCSDLLLENLFENSWPSASNFKFFSRSLEQFIQTVKRSEQFLVTECFLTCSWRFLRSNKLEQLEFKLEKIIGIQTKLCNQVLP